MNITFQNQNNVNGNPAHGAGRAEYENARAARGEQKRANAADNNKAVDVSFLAGAEGFGTAVGAMGDREREKSKTLTELQQEAANMDVGISQDYMTLMSHTMSEEDYAKLSEEGFHFASMDPEEAVTIVDRIKAELVRSGKQVAGYTDDLDLDTLAAVLGSETLAKALTDAFQAADIPLTAENLAGVQRAWDMASELENPGESAYQYMIDNEMDPEVWSFYLAQNSGVTEGHGGGIPTADFLQDENVIRQVDRILEQAGYELNEENRQDANWLLERDLPLTAENLDRLSRLRSVEFPVTEEAFAGAAAEAVAEGKEPVHANLAHTEEYVNPYEKAQKVLAYYAEQFETNGDIAARRQLEEIRLRMTAEVNVKLIKSGFAIDTAPMEELIEALREAEKSVAEQYFPGDDAAVQKYENWNETNRVMDELPELPAQLLGTVQIAETAEEATQLSQFYSEGKNLQQTYARAGESYEALMTAPRADLGDNIRKAFANVDDILKDLGFELTEENRRAVRILGYNHMEMTAENINSVREADAQVNSLIEKMTPAATLKMIRDGVNPLEKSFAQLNQYFDELPESFREQSERYSRFLYGLEQNKQITQEERDSYIGMYRLLRQIERSDGAAVGAVVNVQAELQFSNLLSAVRSGRFHHMDVKATDELGMLKELVRKGEGLSISEQISQGYEKQQLEEIRRAVQVDAEVPAMLQRGELPVNAENLLAAQGLVADAGNPFKALREKSERLREANEVWENLDEKGEFQEQYDAMVSGLQEEIEEFSMEEAQTSLDVRALQMAHKQLSVMGALADREEYILPMYVGDELAAVHLTLARDSDEKGSVFIAVDFSQEAHVEAHLSVQDGRVSGFLVGNTEEEVRKLQGATDIFSNLIDQNASLGLEAADLPVVSRGNIKMTRMSENNSREQGNAPDNGMLYHVAKLFLQAIR